MVGGEDECAQTFCDHGEVGVDHVGGFCISEPESHAYRLIEGMDLEVAQGAGQVRLSCRLTPDLDEHRMSCVQIMAALSGPLDQGPQSGVQVLAVED